LAVRRARRSLSDIVRISSRRNIADKSRPLGAVKGDLMLVINHVMRLLRDLVSYAWINEIWWPVPVVVAIVAIGFLAITTQLAVPYIYTLF
jgi:hypothetical protein